MKKKGVERGEEKGDGVIYAQYSLLFIASINLTPESVRRGGGKEKKKGD